MPSIEERELSFKKPLVTDQRRSTLPFNFLSETHKSIPNERTSCTSVQLAEKLFPNASDESNAPRYGSFPDTPLKPSSSMDMRRKCVFEKGLSQTLASAFLAVVVASNGVMEMPKALSSLGWFGSFFLLLMFWNSMYCSLCLGQCWRILEKRWPEYTKECRNPYPTIAYRAVGPWMKYIVSFLMDVSLIFVCITHLLVSSSVMGNMLKNERFCYWIIVLALVWLPITWYGTPCRFWFLTIINIIATELAIVLMIIHVVVIRTEQNIEAKFPKKTFNDFIGGVGTTAFFFGGASAFPTIHTDMKRRDKYFDAVVGGYIGVLVMYLPLAYIGFAGFGHKVGNNILTTIDAHSKHNALSLVHDFLYVVHMSLSFVIAINPVVQDIEECMQSPKKFNYKRCLVRSATVLIILLISLSLPSLSLVLKLIVSLAASCLSFIFPPIFYVILLLQEKRIYPHRKIGRKNLIILLEIVIAGIFLSVASTYVPSEIADAIFPVSCYRNMSASESPTD